MASCVASSRASRMTRCSSFSLRSSIASVQRCTPRGMRENLSSDARAWAAVITRSSSTRMSQKSPVESWSAGTPSSMACSTSIEASLAMPRPASPNWSMRSSQVAMCGFVSPMSGSTLSM